MISPVHPSVIITIEEELYSIPAGLVLQPLMLCCHITILHSADLVVGSTAIPLKFELLEVMRTLWIPVEGSNTLIWSKHSSVKYSFWLIQSHARPSVKLIQMKELTNLQHMSVE